MGVVEALAVRHGLAIRDRAAALIGKNRCAVGCEYVAGEIAVIGRDGAFASGARVEGDLIIGLRVDTFDNIDFAASRPGAVKICRPEGRPGAAFGHRKMCDICDKKAFGVILFARQADAGTRR